MSAPALSNISFTHRTWRAAIWIEPRIDGQSLARISGSDLHCDGVLVGPLALRRYLARLRLNGRIMLGEGRHSSGSGSMSVRVALGDEEVIWSDCRMEGTRLKSGNTVNELHFPTSEYLSVVADLERVLVCENRYWWFRLLRDYRADLALGLRHGVVGALALATVLLIEGIRLFCAPPVWSPWLEVLLISVFLIDVAISSLSRRDTVSPCGRVDRDSSTGILAGFHYH